MEDLETKYDRYILLSKDQTDSPAKSLAGHFIAGAIIIAVLYRVSGNNYLVFHSVIGLFSIATAWALFMLIWNTRNRIVNTGLVFLGISYFFVGLLYLIHLISFKGMDFTGGPDMTNQTWMAARLLESLSLLIFPWLFSIRIRHEFLFFGFLAATILLLLSIFSWDIFPPLGSAGIENSLTSYGMAGSYAIIAILLAAILSLYRHRYLFDHEFCDIFSASITLGILSELLSAFFNDISWLPSQTGILLKFGSFFLIYFALIRKGIRRPFNVLFREIAKAATDIKKAKNDCRIILDNQPDQIMLHDLNSRIIWANKAACQYAGLPEKEIEGRLCFEIWGQNNKICPGCSVKNAIKTGINKNNIIKTPDGESWQIRNCPIHDETGTVTQILELRENITDRLKAEEKLRLSENNFQKTFNNSSSIMMSISDIETGIFYEANEAFLKITGYKAEELLGRSSLEIGLVDIDSREKMRSQILEKGRYESINIKFITRTGSLIHCLCSGEILVIEGQQRMLSIAQDMTDFFRTRAELEWEKSLLQAVFESTPDVFILKDRQSVYHKVNPAFCNFMGMKENQITGKTDYDFYSESTAAQYILEDSEVIETGRASCLDRQFSGQNEVRWVQVLKTPVKNAGGITNGVLCSIRDVSERKQMEELMKARLRISDFSLSNTLPDILKKALGEAENLTESSISFFSFIEYNNDSAILETWCLDSENRLLSPDSCKSRYEIGNTAELIECVAKQKPVIHNDYICHSNSYKLAEENIPVTRNLAVPVFQGGKIAAILSVGNKTSDYSQRDMDTVMELANMVWDIITRKRSQMELLESQRTLKTLVDNLPGMAFRCGYDSGWALGYASDGCFQLTGYHPEELIKNRFYDLIHPDDRSRLKLEIEKSVRQNRPYEIEYRISHKNSSSRWVWERGIGILDKNGRVISLEGFVTDITEEKTAKDMLRQQTRIVRTILDGIPDILLLMRPDHTIISANRAGYEKLGKKPDEMEGRKCFEIFGRDHRCKKCATAMSLKTGQNATMERFEPAPGRWFQINTIPVFEEDGRISMVVEQLQDITERREREAELRHFVSAIHQVAETIVITDADGTIKYANPSFERVTGYSCKEATGKKPSILKSGKQDDFFYRDLWQTVTSGEIWHGRIVNRKKDGNLFTEEASISPVFDDKGIITEFVAVKRDITNELDLEAKLFQAQKMEAIGSLAGGIAHDFNNLLFPLLGYAEMLQMDLPEDSPLQDHVLEILRASKRAKNLVQQILAFSRQSKQEKTAVRIQNILNEVIRFSRASIPSTIIFRTDTDKTCRPVLADPTQIHQVAMNLLTNAYHAMEENGGTLGISLREVFISEDMMPASPLPGGYYARLSVSDTGCGIDSSIRDKIFNPYFTTKEKNKGTGIGLAVVHGIVKSHGGGIEIQSEPGKGSTFDIFLPCIKEDRTEIHKDIFVSAARGNENILVVDDEEPIARMVKKMLERAGYSVTMRISSIETLQLFKSCPDMFDLVITDMTMPGMTGDQLAAEMKKIRPAMPIIICTGFSEKLNEEITKAMGIQGYVFKPVLQRELTGKIREILDSRNITDLKPDFS